MARLCVAPSPSVAFCPTYVGPDLAPGGRLAHAEERARPIGSIIEPKQDQRSRRDPIDVAAIAQVARTVGYVGI
jgi:hypothetical protein